MKVLVPDRFCDSVLEPQNPRDGCTRFKFYVNTWIGFHGAGQIKETTEGKETTWNVKDWPPGTDEVFRSKFVSTIQDGFGNGAMWILIKNAETGDPPKNLWCDVQIAIVNQREKAQLCINAINDPTAADGSSGGYRSSCWIEGESLTDSIFSTSNPIDMTITNAAVTGGDVARTKPASDSTSPVTFYQNTLMHEFGHYLGLHHFCEGAGASNSAQQYCANRTKYEQNDLMAVGNELRSHHVAPFLKRIGAHDYAPRSNKFGFIAKDRTTRPWAGDPNWSWAK